MSNYKSYTVWVLPDLPGILSQINNNNEVIVETFVMGNQAAIITKPALEVPSPPRPAERKYD